MSKIRIAQATNTRERIPGGWCADVASMGSQTSPVVVMEVSGLN